MQWLDWLMTHVTWEWIAGAAVLIASVANLITSHYGDERPGLKKALLFVVDLLSILVSRGSTAGPGRVGGISGLKMPLVQTSPTSRKRTNRIAKISAGFAIWAMLLSGCATWQSTATKTVLGVEASVKATHTFLSLGPCSHKEIDAIGTQCSVSGDKECKAMLPCETAFKAEQSALAGVHAAKLAIQAGSEGTAQAAVAALLRLVPIMQKAVEVWR